MPAFIPNPTWWRNSGYNHQQMLAWIPPLTFLNISQRIMYINPQNLTTPYESVLTERMQKGLPIDPLFLLPEDAVILDVRTRHYKIIKANPRVTLDPTDHEGRNRSAIAIRLGIPYVPVRFDISPLKNWFSGYEIFDKIWEKPKIEADILRYLGIRDFKLDVVG